MMALTIRIDSDEVRISNLEFRILVRKKNSDQSWEKNIMKNKEISIENMWISMKKSTYVLLEFH